MAITAGNIPSPSSAQSDIVFSYQKMGVQLFHGAGLQGTRASVVVTAAQPADPDFHGCLNDDNEALCWVWPQKRFLQVRCFYRGQPIRFCGHGLLASVYAWQACHPQHSFPFVIRTADDTYTATWDKGIWLHCPRIFSRGTRSFPKHWFDIPPERAARTGEERGYWIFRWPCGFDLKRIGPQLDTMARETRRGVIVTAERDSDSTVTVRYFAPAYGQPEDSATGSAAVVLADYWGRSDLLLEQHSARGGILRTRLGATSVALSGAIRGLHEETSTE